MGLVTIKLLKPWIYNNVPDFIVGYTSFVTILAEVKQKTFYHMIIFIE